MKQLIIISCLIFFHRGSVYSQLTNSGNIRTFNGANITIYGDVTNNGSIADSGTLVTLAGSNLQTIGGSVVMTLNNLTLNNTSASGITLAQALNVRGIVTFTDGYLNTTAVNLLTLTSTSSVTGVNNNSFVSGPVMKTGNTAFVFPVGKNVVYAPIAIAAPSVITDQFTAEYFQVSPNALYSTSSLEPALHHVSECEYWMLDRTTGSSDVSVTLSWDTRSCGVTVPSDLRVARWDGAQWTDKGNGGTTGTTTAGTVISAAAVTGFGPFTLASSTASNPLPVTFNWFAAQCENKQAILRWNTESELQNDFFTIESSLNALDWQYAATIDGTGTSTAPTTYSWTDVSGSDRGKYYRLSQTDLNGEKTVHGIVYQESCLSAPDHTLNIYPNPARSSVYLLTEETITEVIVMDSEGKILENAGVDLENKQVDFSTFPNGVYYLKIATKTKHFNEKVVLVRD